MKVFKLGETGDHESVRKMMKVPRPTAIRAMAQQWLDKLAVKTADLSSNRNNNRATTKITPTAPRLNIPSRLEVKNLVGIILKIKRCHKRQIIEIVTPNKIKDTNNLRSKEKDLYKRVI